MEDHLTDIDLKGARTGLEALDFVSLAPVSELPVLDVLSATDILADLTPGLGRVFHGDLA